MLGLKLKSRFSIRKQSLYSPRIIFNLNPKKKFTLFDLRKLYYGYMFIKQNDGSLILQNREHRTQNVLF